MRTIGLRLTSNRRDEQGFTLVEVLLSLGVMMVVMIPLFLWVMLVIGQSDPKGSDETNAMTLISQYLARDVSGVKAPTPTEERIKVVNTAAEASAVLASLPAECKAPDDPGPQGTPVLKLHRQLISGDQSTVGAASESRPIIVYTVLTDAASGNKSLHRFECNGVQGLDIEIVPKLKAVPVFDLKATNLEVRIGPDNARQIQVSIDRNDTPFPPTTLNQGPIISPVISCSPACTVKRAGHPSGAGGSGALVGTVTFDGRLTTSDNPIVKHKWEFGDGQTTGEVTAPISTPRAHGYTCRSVVGPLTASWNPGIRACEFTATLTAWTADGTSKSVTQKVLVNNNAPTVVSLPTTINAVYGKTVDFQAKSTDVDGVAANAIYLWDFGDGAIADGVVGTNGWDRVAAHAYTLPAGSTARATLTVTDDDGDKTVITIPVVVSAAPPVFTMKISCVRGGVPESDTSPPRAAGTERCLQSSSPTWTVTFDATGTRPANPSQTIRRYRWSVDGIAVGGDANGWRTGAFQPMTYTFLQGVSRVDLDVETSELVAGEYVVATESRAVSVLLEPSAAAVVRPGLAITPENVTYDSTAAQNFVLDGSASADPNPGGGIIEYLWQVWDANNTLVYKSPDGNMVPIVGCTGFMTPSTTSGTPWTVGPTGTTACPKLTPIGQPDGTQLPPGRYTAQLRVRSSAAEELFGSSEVLNLKVNRPPVKLVTSPSFMSSQPNDIGCDNSAASCVYRTKERTFTATTATDLDPPASANPSEVFTYQWNFDSPDGLISQVGKTVKVTFVNLGPVTATLTVTDSDGGYQKYPFNFTVHNQPPVGAMMMTTPAMSTSLAANIFADLTPSDRAIGTFSAATSTDPESPPTSLLCTWNAAGETRTDRPCAELQTFEWTAYSDTNQVSVVVKDPDGGTNTRLLNVRILRRPTVTFTTQVLSSTAEREVKVRFTPTGTDLNAGAGTLKYHWVWGDSGCDVNGDNCNTMDPVTTSGVREHTFSRGECDINLPNCGKWSVRVWVESSIPHGDYTSPLAPTVDPNGWSHVSAPALITVNVPPRLIFNPSSGVSSGLGPDGSSSVAYATSSSIANANCAVGVSTNCTYQANATTSYDPDPDAGFPVPCVGTTCLTYKWRVISSSNISNVRIDNDTSATPVFTFNRLNALGQPYDFPSNGTFTVELKITEKGTGNAFTTRNLLINDLAAPGVTNICGSRVLTSLERNVEIQLDGKAWGKDGTSTCTSVTDRQHFNGFGQFNGEFYSGSAFKYGSVYLYDMRLDIIPSSGGNPAQIVRKAGSFVDERFLEGSKVIVRRAQNNTAAYIAAISSVSPTTLTLSSLTAIPGSPAPVTETNVRTVVLETQCGYTQYGQDPLQCIPNVKTPGSANYTWNFVQTGAPAGPCSKTVYGFDAKVTFATTTPCTGKVTLTVRNENGLSTTSPEADFAVNNAAPVANVDVTSPVTVSNPTSNIKQTALGFNITMDGAASRDPDGVINVPLGTVSPGPVKDYRWSYTKDGGAVQYPNGAGYTTNGNLLNLPVNATNGYGLYVFTLSVRDNVDTVSAPRTVTVEVRQKPSITITATATSPSSCATKPAPNPSPDCTVLGSATSVDFNSSSTFYAPATGFTSVVWTFTDPDGYVTTFTDPSATLAGNPPAKDFSKVGEHQVRLDVTDTLGTVGTAYAKVVVPAAPAVTIDARYEWPAGSGTYVACPAGNIVLCAVSVGSPNTKVRMTAVPSPTSAGDTFVWTRNGSPMPDTTATINVTYSSYVTDDFNVKVTNDRGAFTNKPFKVKVNRSPVSVVKRGSSNTPPTSVSIDRNVDDTSFSGENSHDDDTPAGELAPPAIASWTWIFTETTSGGVDLPAGDCTRTFTGLNPTVRLSPAAATCQGRLQLEVADIDGATTRSASIPFTVQRALPVVVITPTPASGVGSLPTGQTQAVTITFDSVGTQQPGGGTIATLTWVAVPRTANEANDAALAASCATTPVSPCVNGSGATFGPSLSAGSYRAYLRAVAQTGETAWGHLDFSVRNAPDPKVTASVLPARGTCPTPPVGQPVHCSVVDENPDPSTSGPYTVSFGGTTAAGAVAPGDWSWAWNFGDPAGANNTPPASTNPSASHTFSGYGEFTVTVTVTDAQGAVGTAIAIVTVHPRPSVTLDAEYSVDGGGTYLTCTGRVTDCVVNGAPYDSGTSIASSRVKFTRGATSPMGTITGYAWDFGDGQTSSSTSPDVYHDYDVDYGTYTATLTVTDGNGAKSRATFDIKVNRPPTAKITSGAAGSDVILKRNTPSTGVDGATSVDTDRDNGFTPPLGIATWAWTFTGDSGAPPECTVTVPAHPAADLDVTLNPPQILTVGDAVCSGTLSLVVTDDDGGVSAPATRRFVVENVKPTAAIQQLTKIVGANPLRVAFSPVGSQDADTVGAGLPNGAISGYEWTMYRRTSTGPDVWTEQSPGPQLITSFDDFTYYEDFPLTTVGTYRVRLVVIDTHGARSAETFLNGIQVVEAPTARYRLTSAPEVSGATLPSTLPLTSGATVRPGAMNFDGSTSTPAPPGTAAINLYQWEMCAESSTNPGTCSTVTGAYRSIQSFTTPLVTFSVTNADTYLVKLTVRDTNLVSNSTPYSKLVVRP